MLPVPELFEGSECVNIRPVLCDSIEKEVDCKDDYIQKNCQKSCDLCPGNYVYQGKPPLKNRLIQ